MNARVHASTVNGESVYLFSELRGGIFAALQLHAAAFYHVRAACLLCRKLRDAPGKLIGFGAVIIYLMGDLGKPHLRSCDIAFHALDRFAAAFYICAQNSRA